MWVKPPIYGGVGNDNLLCHCMCVCIVIICWEIEWDNLRNECAAIDLATQYCVLLLLLLICDVASIWWMCMRER